MRTAARLPLSSQLAAALCVVFGSGLTALSLQTVLSDSDTATALLSRGLWDRIVSIAASRGAIQTIQVAADRVFADFNLLPVFLGTLAASAVFWLAGAILISARRRIPYTRALAFWGTQGWLWWSLPGIREGLLLVSALLGLESLNVLLLATPDFWFALLLAGWLATLLSLCSRESLSPAGSPPDELPRPPNLAGRSKVGAALRSTWPVLGLMAAYTTVFTAMNWQLYRGLLTPHGDTVMYEEHLWNVLHGKGFLSYLDQGLFLGEHIQVIHLFLIPVYLLWPSHLLLELCQSLAISCGALPVFWLARRHTDSRRAALLLAAAYLLYFPVQFLDIAIDLKTFRPIAFGVPLLLFALDQLERRRYWTMATLLLIALSAKEDYSIILAPLGVWIALRQYRSLQVMQTANRAPVAESTAQPASPNAWLLAGFGFGLALFATIYLVFATRVAIPWFRHGAELHYVSYFSKLGESPREILWNMATNPALLASLLLTLKSALYAIALLAPLGFVSLLSPGRLAVGFPLFMTLCLNQIAKGPHHHFHAPVIPIIFWAAAAGLGVAMRNWHRVPFFNKLPTGWPANFVFTCALATGLFFSLSPLGRQFWDPGSEYYWKRLYVPGKRAAMFARIEPLIPQDAIVASTDFVHPRFTHHRKSYDYSDYPRGVNNNKPGAPPDTEYIVIDTQHPYSKIKRPADIPEYRDHPGRWELLPDATGGYFIVLKARKP